MKKAFKMIASAAIAISMFALSVTALADMPETSVWSGRIKSFDETDGDIRHGAGIYSVSGIWGEDDIKKENGYLWMVKSEAGNTLSWQDYVNGSYGYNNGYITVKMTKLTANTIARIQLANCINTELKWDRNGKLYAKYGETASSTKTDFAYVCDMDGLDAEITIYLYKPAGIFSVAVNGEMKKLIAYTDTNNDTSAQIRFWVDPGAVGDGIKIDYVKPGEITRTSNADTVSFSERFAGNKVVCKAKYNAFSYKASASNPLIYTPVFEKATERMTALDMITPTVTTDGDYTIITAEGNETPVDLSAQYLKLLTWQIVKPLTNGIIYDSLQNKNASAPSFSSVYRNGLHWESSDGAAYGTIDISGSEGTASRVGKIIRGGEDGYMAIRSNTFGAYPLDDYALLNFTLEKSSKTATGSLEVLPCEFIRLEWNDAGEVYACLRESAAQEGPSAQWVKIYDAGDDTSLDFVAELNVTDSTYRLWIDGECVVYDMYSRAVYAGQHVLPEKVEFIRISSTEGAEGDWFAIKNFKSGV